MKHYRADQKYEQWTLLQEYVYPNRLAVAGIFLCATCSLVIDLIGADCA